MTKKLYSLALLGAGTVNGALASIISERNSDGQNFQIKKVFVRDLNKKRENLEEAFITNDPDQLSFDDVDIVVEALGGLEPARTLALRAIECGKVYVTANKTLISYHGEELLCAAKKSGSAIYFEAAVGGFTPCLRILRDTMHGVGIKRISGILNGTSHFVLSKIRDPKISLDEAVAIAQEKGYAEADPSADLKGHDAAQKLSIIGWCVSGELIPPDKIPRVELPTLSTFTAHAVARIGFTVKPIASLSWTKEGVPETWIAPAVVPSDSPLAATTGTDASVVIETKDAGTLFLSAPGAGGLPTASAVYDDLIDAVSAKRFSHPYSGKKSRIACGGACEKREWVVHAPLSSEYDGIRLGRHIAQCSGEIQRFEKLGENGCIAHVSSVNYHPEFTEPLVRGGACVLEVVK
jgi:homoserine dehydrogenase